MFIAGRNIDPAISEAEQVVDADREQRLFHESFENPTVRNSRLVIAA